MIRIYSLKMDRELNEGERQQALDILTPERKAKALRFRRFEDQSKGIGTGLLEAYALQQMGGDVHSCQMKHGEQGKPYIEEHPDVFYNLSHSGHWIVCAVGTQNLGIDIEQESKYKEGVVIRCFPEEEGKILMEEEPEKRPGVFAAYWTMKESFMKFSGLGFSLPLKAFLTDLQTGRITLTPRADIGIRESLNRQGITEQKLPFCRRVPLEQGYACSLCIMGEEAWQLTTVTPAELISSLRQNG